MSESASNESWQPADSSRSDYHIEATESLVERTLRSLKHNDLFAVFDQQGNFDGGSSAPDGLFYKDTRFVSRFKLRLGGVEPLQLGSVVLDDNGAMVVDLTNADLHSAKGNIWLQRESVHLSRFKFLSDDTAYERIRMHAYGPVGRPIPLDINFDSDFADLFEVRGSHRAARGSRTVTIEGRGCVRYSYRGLDGVVRESRFAFEPPPTALTEHGAHWSVDLDEHSVQTIVIRISCHIDRKAGRSRGVAPAFRAARKDRVNLIRNRVHLDSSNSLFDAVIARAWSDIDMLTTETPYGAYPYAGLPWYSTIFGRDGIITAIQMLWCAPYIAQGVLKALANLQATDFDPDSDSQPGKILHEMRGGEMAALGEVPFRRYYGSVDSTPLFVLLAGLYFERTGDLDTIRQIWPNIQSALNWIDVYGDEDSDGFVEYARMTESGLSNQGWKDSADSIFHADGRLAQGPIALCEVQAYVFAAKMGAAELALRLGEHGTSETLIAEASELRQRFEERFWLDDLGTYALALDGAKQPCAVLASNAGHCLFAGIAAPDRARRVANLLTGDRFFSGWGIRTIAAGEARYNPMSYHNGSVWPHDNALIALGFARYGFKKEVATVFGGIFESATYDELRRLPELFCGFAKRRRRGPTSYPVACSPQAWAAATPFALVAAAIGCGFDLTGDEFRLDYPVLPSFLDELTLGNLKIGDSALAIRLSRTGPDVTAAVIDRQGPVRLRISK